MKGIAGCQPCQHQTVGQYPVYGRIVFNDLGTFQPSFYRSTIVTEYWMGTIDLI